MDESALTTWISLAALFLTGFITTFLTTPLLARMTKKRGVVGTDVHKAEKPSIPDMCGLAITISLVCSAIVLAVVFPSETRRILAFTLCVGIAGVIGVADDLRPLSPRLKPLLTAAGAVPIVLLGTYSPYVEMPFLGTARLTIV